MGGHDSLSVVWDDKTGGLVEMHKPDGIPDIVQQVAHGIKYVLHNTMFLADTEERWNFADCASTPTFETLPPTRTAISMIPTLKKAK